MDINAFFAAEFAEHESVLKATQAQVGESFARLVAAAFTAVRDGGKLMFFGNGGSAADAQHLATELAVRYVKDRAPIAAIALTTDSSALTAIGNDIGFDALFARQIEAIGKPGDVAIGITTSGRSRNILRALEAARRIGIVPAALSGGTGGDLPGLADPLLIVPSRTTARIQEMHILLGQMLCGALEQELGLV
ncbi:MAG: SIS domain-containing protein [Alphaproteobacteria bacterium]|nr:SIS domain-containing protein [Alphaproteobacteria bacterium]